MSAAINEKESKDFKHHVTFEFTEGYKPFNQKNVIQGGGPVDEHPEIFQKLLGYALAEFDNTKPGYTQIDRALQKGAFSLKFKMLQEEHKYDQHRLDVSFMPKPQHINKVRGKDPSDNVKHLPVKKPGNILEILCGDFVHDERYQFNTKREAAKAVKRAARFYGADLVGITKRDKHFDYDPMWNYLSKTTFGWDKFPFEPKSVIVLAFEMDYAALTAAPSLTADSTTGEGYSQIHKTTYQLAVFLKNLGYQAAPAENELGLSIPYAVLAGLGEHARNGLLITNQYGPRVRIGKVYTDLDFLEYDSPIKLGVANFCKSCMRCADACPQKAIMKHPEPTSEPTFKYDGNWYVNPGSRKFYNNTLKCFDWWSATGNSCASCITSCPFNKPDFWYHRLVRNLVARFPGPLHDFMRKMDIVFGYGKTFDQKAIEKFWDSGKS